jgi:hypothetical protein
VFAESSVRVSLYLLFAFVLAAFSIYAETSQPVSLVQNYSVANALRLARLRGATMDIQIFAQVPRLKKVAQLTGLRRISNLGKVSYEGVHTAGDATVRQYVIARYLSAESQSQNRPDISVTPANYRFNLRGTTQIMGRRAFLFSVRPIKKHEGLYRGQLWVDATTGMPIRESGRLFASSVFLRRIEFVRTYRFQNEVSIPEQLNVLIDTRVVGKAELTVAYTNVTLPEQPDAGQVLPADLQ